MTSDYYSRTHTVNSDGVRGFATKQDVWNQQKAATEFANVLGAEMKEFGQLCAIDYYALVKGKMAGVVEVKCRSHESSRFPTVFLNVRKWLALQMASVGLGGCRRTSSCSSRTGCGTSTLQRSMLLVTAWLAPSTW